MIEKLVANYVTRLKANKLIGDKQEEIVKFGMCEVVYFVLEMIVLLGSAAFMKQFLGGVILLAVFMPVRMFAGGFHEQTRLRCIVRTSMLYLVLLYCLKYGIIPENVRVIIMIITTVLLWKFAPVQSENHELDENQILLYRRKAIIFWIIVCVLFIIFLTCKQYYVAHAISLGMCMMFYVLLFAVI